MLNVRPLQGRNIVTCNSVGGARLPPAITFDPFRVFPFLFYLFPFAFCLSLVTESATSPENASRPERSFPVPVSRPASVTARAPIARIVLASALALVVLAGVVPPDSFASSHECGMACCVGKAPHTAGSCSTGLGDDESEAQAPADEGGEHAAHGHAAHTAQHSSAHHSTHQDSRRTARVALRTLTKPCSPECAAAAYSSSQVRRPRHAASTVAKAQPRPPAARSFVGQFVQLPPKAAGHVRQARPRAPPSSSVNLSA
jgi:hypothetical protein